MIRIHQVKTDDPDTLREKLLKKLNMPEKDLLSWKIRRKSVDARGHKVLFSYVIDAEVRHEKKYLKNKDVTLTPDERFVFTPKGAKPLLSRPVVAGFGPAGMFAALLLAQYGYRPIIIERGSAIEQRQEKVEAFWKTGKLDEQSNVQFGMGGAGAFSDGKLTTRSKDPNGRKVLEELVRMGAHEDILIEQHPHVGTDGFVVILKNLRKEIERLGGTFLFDTRLDGLDVKDGALEGIDLSDGSLPCQALILAIGHSAGDTIRKLSSQGLAMEPKPFAVGMRIEHLQSFIDKAMLHDHWQDPRLTPARWQMTHTAKNGRGVYSFCMCPGGYVIPSSSQNESIVVNGMSYADRAGENANAALLVQVKPEDLGDDLFAGMDYQEAIEKKAWQLSHSFQAPASLATDYLAGRKSEAFGSVKPTYELGTCMANLNDLFDPAVNEAMHEALNAFEKKVPGFLEDAVLSAPETRSSSSVRIVRDGSRQSNISGLFPCGEGAGYAGGIMTSAIDGLHCAMALMDVFDRPKEGQLQ